MDSKPKRLEVIETICIGKVAEQMGFANQTKVCNAGKAVFKYIGELTYKDFGLIKKHSLKINKTNEQTKI